MNAWNIYDDLADIGAVRRHVEAQMDEYNVSPGVVHLDLILFRDAIEHVCRIVRVISQVGDSYRVPHKNKHFTRRRYVLKLQVCHYNISYVSAREIFPIRLFIRVITEEVEFRVFYVFCSLRPVWHRSVAANIYIYINLAPPKVRKICNNCLSTAPR